jgi:hypothetical protein
MRVVPGRSVDGELAGGTGARELGGVGQVDRVEQGSWHAPAVRSVASRQTRVRIEASAHSMPTRATDPLRIRYIERPGSSPPDKHQTTQRPGVACLPSAPSVRESQMPWLRRGGVAAARRASPPGGPRKRTGHASLPRGRVRTVYEGISPADSAGTADLPTIRPTTGWKRAGASRLAALRGLTSRRRRWTLSTGTGSR